MAFLQEDDAAFEAALSFLDEFAPGTTAAEDPLRASSLDAPLPILDDAQDASDSLRQETKRGCRRKAPTKQQLTEEGKKRRKMEFNERRRLLRKAGVYGDANRARNERAREITNLREQTEKLQIDLQILQTRRAYKQSKETDQENESVLAKRSSALQKTNMWQGLADQQRRRREVAERDNVLLRLAVERQRKVANSLQSQMQRRATQMTNECASLVTTAQTDHHAFNVLDFRGDMESFRELFQRLDRAYQKMDEVFMETGLAGMTLSPVDVHLHELTDGKSLEFASYKVLPFDVRSTAKVTWDHFKGIEKHLANGNLYEKAEKGLDEPYTIIANFKKEVFGNCSQADIKVKQLIRRYVEEDRDIVIWVSRAVAIEVKHKLLSGLTYCLQGCVVTKRSSESTPDREVAMQQIHYLVSLDQDVDMRCNPTDLQALINFLATSTVQNIRAHRERIENALIDRSLAIQQ